MNLEKIDDELPNGFHDACLINIPVDYCGRKIILELDIFIGDPEAKDEASRQKKTGAPSTFNCNGTCSL